MTRKRIGLNKVLGTDCTFSFLNYGVYVLDCTQSLVYASSCYEKIYSNF